MKRLSALVLATALGGCMVGPDYQRPEVPMTDDWHASNNYATNGEPSLAESTWLEIFHDEQLQSVVKQALAQNKQLLIALERIEESRAIYTINRSALYPGLDFAIGSEREHESDLTNTDASISDEYFLGGSAYWELDLWGKNRRGSNAAYRQYLASEYGAQAVRLSLIAEVIRTYFELQGQATRLDVNYETLHAREQSTIIAEKRFRGGLTSKLEVKQAEVELAASRALIPPAQQVKLVAENQLSILMGLPPQHLTLNSSLEDQYIPATVLAGLPASLLERRPDILQAEQQLQAASERVGVATARLLPSISLTGDFGFETAEFSDLLDSDGKFWILNIDLIMPLFNAGARRAELTAAESRFNQSRLNYEQVVINALREVSDSLSQFHRAGEALAAQRALYDASKEYLALATKRYRNGVLAYIDVLDAQRLLFGAQIDASVARQRQLIALVDLYKALGGGWQPASIASKE